MTTRTYIRSRKLDKQATFQLRTTTKGTLGGAKESWSDMFGGKKFWASVSNKSGGRKGTTSIAGGEAAPGTHEIEVRYLPGIVPLDVRVTIGSTIYSILHVNNVNEQNDYLILSCDTSVVAV